MIRQNTFNPAMMQALTGTVFTLGFSYIDKGDPKSAEKWFDEAMRISRDVGSITLILYSYLGRVFIHKLLGNLSQSQSLIELAVKEAITEEKNYGREISGIAAFNC